MNFILSRLTPREQRILAYVCTTLAVIIPVEYYYSPSYGILMATIAGSLIYRELLPVSYWMGTAMSAAAWLFCVCYVVRLMRWEKE